MCVSQLLPTAAPQPAAAAAAAPNTVNVGNPLEATLAVMRAKAKRDVGGAPPLSFGLGFPLAKKQKQDPNS